MPLNGFHQGFVASLRNHCTREQKAFDYMGDTILARISVCIEIVHSLFNGLQDLFFDFARIFFRDHAAINLEGHASGYHVGVGSTFDTADIQVGMFNAFD